MFNNWGMYVNCIYVFVFHFGLFLGHFSCYTDKKTKSAQGQLTNVQIQKNKYTNIKNAVPMSNVQYV